MSTKLSMEAVQHTIETQASLDRMVRWLLNAPIRNVKPGGRSYGSFNHRVDPSTGQPDGQYTEITGYGVSLLASLYRWRGEDRFLQAAHAAAQFLLSIQTDGGAYPNYSHPERLDSEGERYSFDTAMCVTGLLDLHAVDPNGAYLESARRAGDWLLTMQRADGSFTAAQDRRNREIDLRSFFGDGSCIHAKNAIALLKLEEASGRDAYGEAAKRVCDYVLRLQAEEGFFWSMPTKQQVFTHAHCYASEGLLAAGAYTDDERYVWAARKGIQWLQQVQNENGSVYQVYHDRRGWPVRLRRLINAHQAADATAQAARLFALEGARYKESYQRAINYITGRLQSPQGGLYYTHGRFSNNQTLYAWPTMFAIEAIEYGSRPASAKDLF